MTKALYLTFLSVLLSQQTYAIRVELNLPLTGAKLNVGSYMEIIGPSVTVPLAPLLSQKLSPVVRIESRAKDFEQTENARWGTGVIVGRYHQGPNNRFKGAEGFLVLTANHVLLEGEEKDAQRLTLFTEDRRAWNTRSFHVYSTSAGEDLALLVVEATGTELMAIDLPKLGFLDPERFRDFSWVPNYTRMNPGLIEQRDLSFSVITPLLRASMVTHDAVNSLAPMTENFWYIGGEFVPGMSGGPVFTNSVQSAANVGRADLDGLLIGIMGYIFDRQSKYGYAYPITEKSFGRLLSSEGPQAIDLPESELIAHVSAPVRNYIFNSFGVVFDINKKKAPDASVADELILKISLGDTSQLSGVYPVSVELQQFNEFPVLNKKKLLELLNGYSPFFASSLNRTGAPGGGGVDGSPGGGGVDGSPGGGGVDGSPGGSDIKDSESHILKQNEPQHADEAKKTETIPPFRMKVASFENLHSIAMVVRYSNGGQRTYLVEKISVNGELKNVEFLKDLFILLKNKQKVEIIARPKSIDSKHLVEKEGLFNLNVLKKDVKVLRPLGTLVWNSGKFQIRSIKGLQGITLNLSTYFRDTQVGSTRMFELKLGLRVDTTVGGVAEPLIVKIMIDNQEVSTPKGLTYSFDNGILKISKQNQSILEVNL